MNKKLGNIFKICILIALTIGITGFANLASAKLPKKDTTTETSSSEQAFENDMKELMAKAQAFSRNASSFTSFIHGIDERNVEKKRDNLISIIEATLENNAELQQLVKKAAKDQPNDQKKRFFMRDILPNLHNINRQLIRIKIGVKRDNINYENIQKQAERTEESIKQVVDRLKANAK